MSDSISPDDILRKYHREYVSLDEAEKNENMRIALDFVQQFCDFVGKTFHLDLECVVQGSSFEGLKVGRPDEYDFMLILLDRPDDRGFILHDPHPILDEIRQMKKGICVLKCYQPIMLTRAEANKERAYQSMREIWPMIEQRYGCLSARGAIDAFHQYLLHFERDGDFEIDEVASVEAPVEQNPALKTVLHKHDGTEITIDISPGVRFFHPETGSYRYYIAKRKPVLRNVHDPRLGLLWMDSYSLEEKELIERKTYNERANYRIVKSLFRDVVGNSFIWKTCFMRQDSEFPRSPIQFMKKMLVMFEGSLHAELKRRRANPTGKRHGQLLTTRFNACENILGRYDVPDLKDWYEKFRYFNDLLENQDYAAFFRKVFDQGVLRYLRQSVMADRR